MTAKTITGIQMPGGGKIVMTPQHLVDVQQDHDLVL
jgi:hypothetical protein